MNAASPTPSRCRGWLVAILAGSLALRLWLAFHGGQGFWPDEARYEASAHAAAALAHGRWGVAAAELLGRADHPLFTWIGLPPAAAELLVGARPALAAAYFSLFSVLVIWLVWRVARRAGAGEREALLAAWLAACATSLFYYARHYFPYDPALALMLLALDAALGPAAARRSLRAGALAGLGFLTYEGYWLLGGVVLVLHVALGAGGWRRAAARAGFAALGLAAVVAGFLALARLAGHDLIAAARANAGTITQGDFGRGYRVIAAYLWHAEGVLFPVWLLGAGVVLGRWMRSREPARAVWWLAGLALVAGGLVLFSDVVPVFVVYGRLVRQLTPFFCLATACAAELLAQRAPRPSRPLAAAAALVGFIAAANFAGPLRQVFPDEFRRLATAAVYRQQQRDGYGVYRVVNDEHLWGKTLATALPPHEVVLQRAHPLQFRPYQYEGYSAAQRRELNQRGIAMQLVRWSGPAGAPPPELKPRGPWGAYPGPVRVTVRFAPGTPGRPQPLVTAGTTGRADLLYVDPVSPERIRFGYDHWGAGAIFSDPVTVDYTRPHELLISMGALLPAVSDGTRFPPALAYLRNELLVEIDGRVVWSRFAAAHAVDPATITWGANLTGNNTTSRAFAGRILRLEGAPLEQVASRVGLLASGALAAHRPPDWQGAVGPVALRCELPAIAPGMAEPLIAASAAGEGDLLFWIRERDDRLRFGFERRSEGVVFSEAVVVPAGGAHRLVLSLGSLMPGEDSPVYRADPAWRRLRDLVLVSLDGQVVFLLKRPFVAPAGSVVIGANDVRSSVVAPFFTGNLLAIEPAEPAAVLAASIQLASQIKSRPAAWAGYPGPVRVRLYFPADTPRLPEPLIVTGRTGRGDFIYVRYEGADRIRIGFDHWGVSGGESPPLTVNPAVEHELAISFGGLMPPADSPLYEAEPAWQRLRSTLWVALDGRPVFVAPLTAHPTAPGQIMFGVNFIGGSTTGANFTGRITQVEDLAPQAVLAQLDATPAPIAARP